MAKIAVLGAGFVTKPAVDYFIDKCGYQVIVTSLNIEDAIAVVGGRPEGTAVAWTIHQHDLLDRIVGEVDLVMGMIPPTMHLQVAKVCLKHGKNMVTTSYISPEMAALDKSCQDREILILNEIGEDPGLDNMNAKKMIDRVRAEKGGVRAVTSYGAGLPAFEHNNNPFGYKFSWSPQGLVSAAQTPAAYLENGRKVTVDADDLFNHHWIVDLSGIGSFETYPNRDCTKYLQPFDLDYDISYYRGLLRYPGWCNTMIGLAELRLFDNVVENDFRGMTYAQFVSEQVGRNNPGNTREQTAAYLNVRSNSDLINRLNWLGLFSEKGIAIDSGTNADLLIELMTKKLSYGPLEKDMVIVRNEILADFSDRREIRISTLLAKGEPGGDSAMSRAVSLPAAIASKLILDNKIKLNGVWSPTVKEIYHPVLSEMEEMGYTFETEITKTDIE